MTSLSLRALVLSAGLAGLAGCATVPLGVLPLSPKPERNPTEPLALLGRPVALTTPVVARGAFPEVERPLVTLSAPVPLSRPVEQASWIVPVQHVEPGGPPSVPPPAMGGPPPVPPPPPAFGSAPPPPPAFGGPAFGAPTLNPGLPPGPDERYNCGVVTTPPNYHWYDGIFSGNLFTGTSSRSWFQSDACFNEFISPITNPFLFEDPRSLTELRPILLYQSVPTSNYAYKGGDLQFYGLQGRLAITDRFSFVINKLGYFDNSPNDTTLISSGSSIAELNLGPKYTFLRNDCTHTLGAFGVTFQLPVGSQRAYQNTGNLSVAPYFSFGQNFGKTNYGSFNALTTFGYSFADNSRSQYYFQSLHIDYDVLSLHKFYPLLELNWFRYTGGGNTTPVTFEGRDLINFGGTQIAGHSDLSIATGARYKFSEHFQLGAAAEFPLNGARDLFDFRVTVDFIFRY